MKRLKEQEIEENHKRRQLVKDFENRQKMDKKNQKIKQIEEDQAKKKIVTVTKGVSRDKIQAQYASELNEEKKQKTIYKENKFNSSNKKISSTKKHERQEVK